MWSQIRGSHVLFNDLVIGNYVDLPTVIYSKFDS